MPFRYLALLLIIPFAAAACGESNGRDVAVEPAARPAIAQTVPNPAGEGSGEPFLATGRDGSLIMSWLEPAEEDSHALRFARFRDGEWSEPVSIVEREDFFVNWADFPSIVETSSSLVVHWLQKSGEGPYSYDVVISRSGDRGRTWSPGQVLHTDGVEAEHGFVSLVPERDGSDTVGALWLDGRNMGESDHGHGDGDGAMTLRFARIHADGTVSDRQELDDRVCECCQTSMVETDSGYVAVYRDRSEGEVRDIGVVRQVDGKWSEPSILHDDGWEIAACPVNGPQLDARGDLLAVAWYTGAVADGRVYAAFSTSGDAAFGAPIRMDEGGAIGRVDTLLIGDQTALVVWLGQNGEVLARTVDADGERSPVYTVGKTSSSRAAGFPRIATIDGVVYIAWTEPEGTSRIRLASIDSEEI